MENLGMSLEAELKITFTTDAKTNLYKYDGTGLSRGIYFYRLKAGELMKLIRWC